MSRLTLKKVTLSLPEYGKIKELYRTAFPADERAPFFLMTFRAMQKKTDFRAVYEDGNWVGMYYIMGKNGLYYLFYLAVDESGRGKGTGSRILSALKKRYEGKRLFLAIEPPDPAAENNEMRLRRRGFYLRNGLEDQHQSIVENTVTYDCLGIGEPPTDEEYRSIMRDFLGTVAVKLIPIKIIGHNNYEQS